MPEHPHGHEPREARRPGPVPDPEAGFEAADALPALSMAMRWLEADLDRLVRRAYDLGVLAERARRAGGP